MGAPLSNVRRGKVGQIPLKNVPRPTSIGGRGKVVRRRLTSRPQGGANNRPHNRKLKIHSVCKFNSPAQKKTLPPGLRERVAGISGSAPLGGIGETRLHRSGNRRGPARSINRNIGSIGRDISAGGTAGKYQPRTGETDAGQNLSQSQIKILKCSMWFRSARLQIDVLRCPICKIGPRGGRIKKLRPRARKPAGNLSCPNRPEKSFLIHARARARCQNSCVSDERMGPRRFPRCGRRIS